MKAPIVMLVLVLAAALASVAVAAHAQKAPALVMLRSTPLGRILVDARGRSLYLFEADKGRRSSCYGACAVAWPPLVTTGKPRAGAGTKASLLGTTKRKGGALQVTYRGHPLYFFVQDRRAGQTTGEGIDGFGGEWYVLSAAGTKVEQRAAAPVVTTTATTPTTTGGGYGGGVYP